MSNLVCNYPQDKFDKLVNDFLAKNKCEDYSRKDLKAIVYTDGGSRTRASTNYGGWGVHGYLYIDKEIKSNSGCKQAVPTTHGYQSSNELVNDKAFVVAYFDFYGKLNSGSTNNITETLAMLRCLLLIDRLGISDAKIYADSEYVLRTLEYKERYKENNFRTAAGKELANRELCMELVEYYDELLLKCNLEINWVKGHSGHFGNDSADANATKGCDLASNEISNIVIKTDDTVSDDYNLNNDYFNIAAADEYFKETAEVPKMLSEHSLFFTTNGIDARSNNTYYQASFGKMLSGKTKDEKKALRGKPFADCCIAVVELYKPDPVINNIINIVSDTFSGTGVIECNLSYQTRQSVYNDLLNGGLNTLSVDVSRGRLMRNNKEEIATLISPVRQSFRLISDFDAVKNFLDFYITSGKLEVDSSTDITSYFYEQTEVKDKIVFKPCEFENGKVTVPIEFTLGSTTKTTHIPITIGVDTPSKISIGRMKTLNPKISLVTWDTTERTLRFAILIESTEGIGVWMGIYSNTHLH